MIKALILTSLLQLLFISTNHAIAAFDAEDRACASMFYSCTGKKKSTATCKQMKKLMKDLKYSCKDIDLKKKSGLVMKCHRKGDAMIDLKFPNWLAVSWDISDPRIFGYCDNPSAVNARRCAVAECKANGGKRCKPLCDPGEGVRLRACRLGVNTYIATSKYGRFGCGTRHVKAGRWSVPGYTERELGRCRSQTKSNKCVALKTWSILSP